MEGDLQRAVGENLRAHREARGVDQETFAHSLGLHRTYLGSIERGERNLSLKKVEWLAAQLEIEPLDLLVRPSRR
jgi:transcriptional regulator with XRE-family HTH domain